MIDKELQEKILHLKLVATDFDGVWTDGKVSVDQNGVENVVCSRKDTLRIKEIVALGIEIIVISKERNPVVAKRCEKMGVSYVQGADDKQTVLKNFLEKTRITPEENLSLAGGNLWSSSNTSCSQWRIG